MIHPEPANGQLDKANWRKVMDEAMRSAGRPLLTTKEFDEAWDDFQAPKAAGEFRRGQP